MGTFGSRDAATELTGTYLQRVPIGCASLNVSSISTPNSSHPKQPKPSLFNLPIVTRRNRQP